MAWHWSQATGKLYSPDGTLFARGYSGAWDGTEVDGPGDHRNKPEYQSLHAIGPIPRGTYTIGSEYTDAHKGPVVMRLTPAPTNEMFGRSGFLIHGDLAPPRSGQASEGCIILNRHAREAIAVSDDRTLVVA